MNTKLFTEKELKKVDINKLKFYLDEFIELSNEMKTEINLIEDIEKEDGMLIKELEYELNIMITQFDYIMFNIHRIQNHIKERKLSN
jgi:hypothetical protein